MESPEQIGTDGGPEERTTATSAPTTASATAENTATEVTATPAVTGSDIPDTPARQYLPERTPATPVAQAVMPETVAETRETTEGRTVYEASVLPGGEPIVVQLFGSELLGMNGSIVRTSTIWNKVIGELRISWSQPAKSTVHVMTCVFMSSQLCRHRNVHSIWTDSVSPFTNHIFSIPLSVVSESSAQFVDIASHALSSFRCPAHVAACACARMRWRRLYTRIAKSRPTSRDYHEAFPRCALASF